jgi:hypothetical protein
MATADASIGEVAITLDDKEVVLKCSLAAAKRVNAGGGYFHVMARLGAMDHDFYVMVVAAGLDKKPNDVEGAVYKAGLPALTERLITFCEYLANGGKPVMPSTGENEPGEG